MPSHTELKLAATLVAKSILPLDRLPYTDEFEPLYQEFVRAIGHPRTRHEVWWCMVDARKRGLVGPMRRRPRPPRPGSGKGDRP
jgi:hypothetical protein